MSMGGQTMKSRFILQENSPKSYNFRFEISQDGTNWMSVMDGKGSKAGAGTATKKK
jgi:hypothetical protein